ncbi:MAG: hypothetical protein QF473_14305 [Planctomycetota bacterium]|jgi:hypothetical protein|nr:hypothetical protein [Planctomycetota bacterium]
MTTNRPREHPALSDANSRVRTRGVVVGLILSASLCFFSAHSNIVYGHYTGFTDHFTTIGVIFVLLFLPFLAVLARRLNLQFLNAADFVVIYAMMMVATVLPTMGFGAYVLPLTAGLAYYANLENRWQELILDRLPDWLFPSGEHAVTALFEGVRPDQPIPWSAWTVPLAAWGMFMLAFFFVSLSILVFVRRQWVEHERLTFPLAAVPLELAAGCDGRSSLLRSPVLWAGAGLSFLIPFVDTARVAFDWMDTIPSLSIPSQVLVFNAGSASFRIMFGVDLLMVGLSFLVSLEVLLSVWFFYLLTSFEGVFLKWFLPAAGGVPHAAGGLYLGSQQTGALFAIVAASLFAGRRSLIASIRESAKNPNEEVMSIRAAFVLGLLGFAFMVGFMWLAGLGLGWAILFVILGLGLMLGTARVLAQTGMGRIRAPHAAGPLMATTFGTEAIGTGAMPALGTGFCWAGDIQLFLMGTCLHALKVVGDYLRNKRGLLLAMTLALIVSTGVTFVTYIGIGSRVGLVNGYGWYFVNSPKYHWNWVASVIENPVSASWTSMGFFGAGTVAAWVLVALSFRIPGWPLHPVGLAICQINTVWYDWFSIFLAWIIKACLLRYGGGTAYRKARPFFIGLILGSCMGIGLKAVWLSLMKG